MMKPFPYRKGFIFITGFDHISLKKPVDGNRLLNIVNYELSPDPFSSESIGNFKVKCKVSVFVF